MADIIKFSIVHNGCKLLANYLLHLLFPHHLTLREFYLFSECLGLYENPLYKYVSLIHSIIICGQTQAFYLIREITFFNSKASWKITVFKQLQIKNIWKKDPEIFKNQNLNFLCVLTTIHMHLCCIDNYLHIIYIVFTITRIAFTLS